MQQDSNVKNGSALMERSSLAYRTYKYRWVVLALYVLAYFASSIQWPVYTTITNVIVDYYNVSETAATWTAVVFMFWYIVFICPSAYLVEKWGLRVAVILASFGSCAGAWIKVASVNSDRFWVIMLGQSVVAITQTVFSIIPAALAGTWFGAEETSTACSIGTFGIQIGVAIGCLIGPMIVKTTPDREATEDGFRKLSYTFAALSSSVLLLVLVGFRDKPPTPPSRAQLNVKQGSASVIKTTKNLFKNVWFSMFLAAYTLVLGVFFGICSMINIVLLRAYPDAMLDIGRIGMAVGFAGLAGCLVFSSVLDRSRQYRPATIFLFAAAVATVLLYSFCLHQGIAANYIIGILMGFFNNAVLPIGLDVAAEITYPEPASISSGIMTIFANGMAIAFTHVYEFFLNHFKDPVPHLAMTALASVGVLILIFIRFDLKRQAVETY